MLIYFMFLLYFVLELKILYDYYFCFISQNPLLSEPMRFINPLATRLFMLRAIVERLRCSCTAYSS